MSPRWNYPRRRWWRRAPAELDLERVQRGGEAVERWGDESWRVRQVPGGAAVKTYRCPGCDQEIRPGVPHLVAWPVEGLDSSGVVERRHWHPGCWRARDRRRPGR